MYERYFRMKLILFSDVCGIYDKKSAYFFSSVHRSSFGCVDYGMYVTPLVCLVLSAYARTLWMIWVGVRSETLNESAMKSSPFTKSKIS